MPGGNSEAALSLEDTVGTSQLALLQTQPYDSKGGLVGLVAIARGKTPDPIPNSAVKTLCADGTAS
jgi:hypothetical protein